MTTGNSYSSQIPSEGREVYKPFNLSELIIRLSLVLPSFLYIWISDTKSPKFTKGLGPLNVKSVSLTVSSLHRLSENKKGNPFRELKG